VQSRDANEPTVVSTAEVPEDAPKVITATAEPSKEGASRLKQAFSGAANILPFLWLTGALALAIYVGANNFILLRIVRRERPLTEQKILDLVEDCKAQMRVRTILGLVATDKVKSPALFGFIRPRLLLPAEMIENISREELRYVFLHELAHLKRHDIYIGWLTSILQVLHWFNPFVWMAFYRIRADRELACDALVLARTQADESKNYGRTIVSLIERFSQPRQLPALAGILETKTQLKRRITMIAQFKKNSYQWSPLAVILIIILGCVSLPDAKRTKAADATVSPPKPGAGAGAGPIVKTVYSGKDTATAAAYGVLAPDESTIALGIGGAGIILRDLRTGETRTLTESTKGQGWGQGEGRVSIWSADSKLIVYWWEEQNQESLRIVSRDGGEPRIIKSLKDGRFDPSDWSQDGKLLVGEWTQWEQAANPPALGTVDVATGELHVLGPEGPQCAYFAGRQGSSFVNARWMGIGMCLS
jgi:beta-lactamase regulating signal transducer with metallopeptidase domain